MKKYNLLIRIVMIAILFCSLFGCSKKNDDVKLVAGVEENKEEVQSESETEKLIIDINITDYYKTDVEMMDNHYYIDEYNVLWGRGFNLHYSQESGHVF